MSDVIERELKQQVHGWNMLEPDVQQRLIETRLEQTAAKPDTTSSRDVAVQLKYAELMAAEGLDVARPELWGLDQYRIRYRCWAEAEAAVPGGDNVTILPASDETILGDPREALAAAIRDDEAADKNVLNVRSALERARDRLDALSRDTARFVGLDDRLARWAAKQAADDAPDDELPVVERIALDERRKLAERTEIASRAVSLTEAEHALAVAEKQRTAQRVRAANAAIEAANTQWLKQELIGIVQHDLELRQRILATAAVIGQLPPDVMQVLNEPRPVVVRNAAMEQSIRDRMAARLEDPDADA